MILFLPFLQLTEYNSKFISDFLNILNLTGKFQVQYKKLFFFFTMKALSRSLITPKYL